MSTTCVFDEPTTATAYTDVFAELTARATVLATMDYGDTTEIPDEAKGYDAVNGLFQIYDLGTTSWSTLDLSGHLSGLCAKSANLSDLANVATARSNLKLGSLALLNTINNANWSGTALSLGNGGTGATSASAARTALELGALATLSTIAASQVSSGTLAIARGGTGKGTAEEAWTALGGGTIGKLNAVADANFSGQLGLAHGGTNGTDATTARASLVAAKSGSNSDITALTNCPNISDNANMTIGPTTAHSLTFKTTDIARWLIDADGDLLPAATNVHNIGSASAVISTIYSVGIQGIAAADFTVKGQSGCGINFIADGSTTAFKILGTAGSTFWQVFAMGANSSKAPQTDACADWWEIRDSAGNARFIPLYTA